MRLFNLDSPLMRALGKMADLMWLNMLTMICCIPIITGGAAITALHYMALKIVRDEECYITRGFFKSFKQNFKQATIIWIIFLLVAVVLVSDIYIIRQMSGEFNFVIKALIVVAAVLALFVFTFAFPMLAKFDNTTRNTLKNAFMASILQFPKTIVMIAMLAFPFVLILISESLIPIAFLFCYSVPAFVGALLYNKFFKKLEDQIEAANAPEEPEQDEEDDMRIFKDELDESIVVEDTAVRPDSSK